MNIPKPKEGTEKHITNGGIGQVRKFSINPNGPVARKEWSIIATHQMKGKPSHKIYLHVYIENYLQSQLKAKGVTLELYVFVLCDFLNNAKYL